MMGNKATVFLFLGVLLSCGSDPIPAPQAAQLVSPAHLEACTTATPATTTQSVVNFNWQDAADTDSYELIIENLVSQARIEREFVVSEASIGLDRGVSYRWWVRSLSDASSETATSEKWAFYLEGEAQVNHIPFPATLNFPEEASQITLQDGRVEFRWQGADLDNDIDLYTLRLGSEEDNLSDLATELTDTRYSTSLESSQRYYWQIVTIDREGNQSYSKIQGFQTQ